MPPGEQGPLQPPCISASSWTLRCSGTSRLPEPSVLTPSWSSLRHPRSPHPSLSPSPYSPQAIPSQYRATCLPAARILAEGRSRPTQTPGARRPPQGPPLSPATTHRPPPQCLLCPGCCRGRATPAVFTVCKVKCPGGRPAQAYFHPLPPAPSTPLPLPHPRPCVPPAICHFTLIAAAV